MAIFKKIFDNNTRSSVE